MVLKRRPRRKQQEKELLPSWCGSVVVDSWTRRTLSIPSGHMLDPVWDMQEATDPWISLITNFSPSFSETNKNNIFLKRNYSLNNSWSILKVCTTCSKTLFLTLQDWFLGKHFSNYTWLRLAFKLICISWREII